MGDRLTHLDESGHARMVDVSAKPVTERVCVARGEVRMAAGTLDRIAAGDLPKGDVLATARIAGIQAAKRTAEWIPLCHPVALSHVEVEFAADGAAAIEIRTSASSRGATGVEMEALTAAAVAALTVYDMCKAVCRGARITDVELLHKTGGKSGEWRREGGR